MKNLTKIPHTSDKDNINISQNDSIFTKKDMEAAFKAGADKNNWTKIKLIGVVSGRNFTLEPIFDKWFKNYH